MLEMPFVDLTRTDAFNQWSLKTGPLKYVAPPAPDSSAEENDKYARFLIDVATVQLGCMAHDPAHRATCTKKTETQGACRFHFPFCPCDFAEGEGPVTLLYPEGTKPPAPDDARPIGFRIKLRRTALSAYQNQCNLGVTAMFRCNNDVKFVLDPGSGYYVTMYHVKSHDEESKQLNDVLATVERSHKYRAQMDPQVTETSSLVNEYTSSLALALRVTRAATASAAVSATNAAYLCLGGERFISSEVFSYLPLGTAERYLKDGQLQAQFQVPQEPEPSPEPESAEESKEAESEGEVAASEADAPPERAVKGVTLSTFQDYVFRSKALEQLSQYEVCMLYERVPKPKGKKKSSHRRLNFDLAGQAVHAQSQADEREELLFEIGHPLRDTHLLRLRLFPATPSILGDRLPDSRELLKDGDEADPDARIVFARRAFLLFVPFRAGQR